MLPRDQVAACARAAAYAARGRASTLRTIAEALGFVVVRLPPSWPAPQWEAISVSDEPTRIGVRWSREARPFERLLAEALGHVLASERLGAVDDESRGVWARAFTRTLLELVPAAMGRPQRTTRVAA